MNAVRPWLLLLAAAAIPAVLASCGGGGSAPSPQLDVIEAGPDASEPGEELPDVEDDAEAGDPGPDGADAPETEVEPPPKAPELSLWLVTATGPKGEQDPEISIATADEPPAYSQSKGLQVDVVVRTANLENGRDVSLQVGSVVVGSQKVVVDGDGVGTATFQAVTFVHSQAGYDVKAWTVNQAKLYGDVTKKVHVDTGGCAVSVLPSNAACLLADADPDTDGVQVVFTVTDPERTCDTAQVDFDAGGGATGSSGPVPLDASGSAKITLTVLADAAGVDGAKVSVVASVGDSANPDRASSLPAIDYTIDLTDPVVVLVSPDKPLLTLADDKDGDPSNGLTLDVAGTATGIAAGSSLSLSLNQQAAGEAAPDGQGAWLFPDVALTADGSYEFVVSGQDACGRTGADSVTFQARVSKATYVILHPSPGGTLLAKDDADPTASPHTDHAYQTDVLVSGGQLEAGTTLTVRCRKDALGSHWVDVGSIEVTGPSADGNYAVPVVLDEAVLGTAVVCQVTDDAPNPGTSSEVAFKVALPAPAIQVLAPAAGASVAAAKLAVGAWAANLDGVEPSVEVRDAGGINVVPDVKPGEFQAGALAFDLDLESGGTPIPDGAYTLVVDATDALGNRASETAGSVTSVAFTLDTTAPTVAITGPDHDTLDPANNPADADADPAKPGHQVVLAVDVPTGGGDGTEVCEQRVGGVLRCATLAGGTTTATFTITVLPGANVVNAWATDPAGNRGDAPARTLTLAVSGPRVTIQQPAGDGPITTLPLDVVVEVTDKDLAPVSGAEVTLEVAGADGANGTTGADGRVTLQIASLAATPTEVLARAQVAGETSWSDPLSLWLKTGKPFIGFLKPLAGDVVNLAYEGCAAGANCLFEVVLEALNCEDDSTGSLTVDCGPGKIQALQAKVKAGTLRFPGSILYDQSTCSLVASVTDLAGQAAAAGPIQVTVDRVAPVVTITRPAPELTGLGYLLDEDPATDGMQYTVRATVAGSAAGRACELTVTGGGTPISAEVPVPAGANPECVFAAVSLPNGSLILEVRADDAAGNATVARRSIEVLWGQPLIRLVVPSYVEGTACATKAECPASAVCGGGSCATPWGATTVRSLRLTAEHVANESGNVRICSNLPGLAGPDCQTAGFRQVAAGTVLPNQALHEVSVAGLPDGLHVLIAEARTLAGAAWVSTLDSPNAIERLRNIYQDTVVPSIQAVTSPSDTLPPVGTLNAAEQVSPGVFTLRATASEPSDVTFYVDGQAKATVATVDGAATTDIALVGAAPRDAVSFQVWAVAKDAVGNLSAQPGPIFAPTVDTKPPTLAFDKPASSLVKCGDSKDVVLTSDAIGRTVTVTDGGIEKASAPVGADGTLTLAFATLPILSEGHHDLSASVSDVAGNLATATRSVDVATVPPTLAVFAPEDGKVLADADDASPADPGFQVNVSFGAVSPDATSWRVDLASNCDAAFAACDEPVVVATGAVTNPGGLEPAVTPTVTAGTTPRFKVIVRMQNAVGCESSIVRKATLALTQCQVSLSGLTPGAYVNNTRCPVPNSNCASVTVPVTVTASVACGAVTTARLSVGGATTDAPFTGQTAAFSPTLADGTQPTIEALALVGASTAGTTGQFQVTVDLTDPVVAYTVPASATNRWGTAADKNGAAAGLQTDLQVSVTDARLAGGRIESLTWDAGGGAVALPSSVTLPLVLTGSPAVVDLPGVTLPDQTTGTVRVIARDLAGNAASAAFKATIDLQAPAAISLLAPGAGDLDPRRPAVRLRWNAVGDNGTDAGTPASSYDVRFSKLTIDTDAKFDAACRVSDLAYTDPLPVPKPVGALESYTVTGPDVRRDAQAGDCRFVTGVEGVGGYWFAVRAVDAAGNRSALSGASVLSVPDVTLRAVEFTGSAPYNNVNYQRRVWRTGDLNGDGKADLAIGGRQADGFCVIYGHANADGTVPDLAIAAATGPNHQCLAGTAGTNLGLPVVALGDVNADGAADIAVGQGAAAASYGLKIWLGVKGGVLATTPNVTITGFQNAVVGAIAAGEGDFDGDGANDLVIGSRVENKAYVVPGNKTWTAATNVTIDLTSAASRTTHRVAVIELSGGTATSLFGIDAGFLADVDNDGFDEIAVSQQTGPGQVVVVRGRSLPAAATITVSAGNTGLPGDANALRAVSDTDLDGFGSGIRGLGDVDGDGRGDLVVGAYLDSKSIYGFYGATLAANWGKVVKVGPEPTVLDGIWLSPRGFAIPGAWGRVLVMGNLDNDPSGRSDDIAYADSASYGKHYVRLNVTGPAQTWAPGTFPFMAPTLVDPADPAGNKFGYTAAVVGDFNGDGFVDLLFGTDGAGYALMLY